MKNKVNNSANNVQYSIWDTRTEENVDKTRERIMEATHQTTSNLETTDKID